MTLSRKDSVRNSDTGKGKQPGERTPNPNRPSANGWKKWSLRVSLAVLLPCVFLALLEAGLRLIRYGYPSTCFLKKEHDGQVFFIENPKFELRFFPPALLRVPSSYTIPARKGSDVYRIFVIGSSAAAGFPEPSYGFSRILEVILKDKYPGKHFEIINTATTAINSNVDFPIVQEAAQHQPDLFIIYDGHNEVLGPFGPGTIFVPYSGNLRAIRSTIFLKSTKVGQLLDNLRLRLMHTETLVQWRGMEMVVNNQLRPDDPRLEIVDLHFRSNLTDMCRAANSAGAKVILGTLGTNLKDAAPFASLHRTGLSAEQLREWESLYDRGVDAASKGNYEAAVDLYRSAATIDDQFADLQFRLARASQHLQGYRAALEHYIEARDDDALRFRADSQINAVIREVAASQQANGVSLVDMEKLMSASAKPQAPGAEFFYDHVHLNFHGNYLLAEAISEQIDRWLAGSPKSALDEDECARRLAFTDWNRGTIAKDLLSLLQDVPFTNQLNHAEQMTTLKDNVKQLFAKGTSQVVSSSVEMYEEALKRATGDWMMHNQYGILLADSGESAKAVEQFREVEALLPYRSWPHVAAAQALAKFDQAEAKKEYQEALRTDSDSRNAHLGLAAVLVHDGNTEQALGHYRTVLSENPQDATALVGTGSAWAREGKYGEAIDAYQRALEINPSLPEAHYRLGDALMRQGATEEGLSHLQKAVGMDFSNADAHERLGQAYEATSQWESAIEQFLSAAAVDSGHLTHYYEQVAEVLNRTGRHAAAELALGDGFSAQHNWSEAASHYAEAVKANPEVAEFHLRLATALRNLGREAQAQAELGAAFRLDPRVVEKNRRRSPALNPGTNRF